MEDREITHPPLALHDTTALGCHSHRADVAAIDAHRRTNGFERQSLNRGIIIGVDVMHGTSAEVGRGSDVWLW